MGRPKLKASKVKRKYIRVRVTDAEHAKITRKAKASKAKSESEWIRKRLLDDD
jgi:hypothetical protein